MVSDFAKVKLSVVVPKIASLGWTQELKDATQAEKAAKPCGLGES